MHAYKLLAKRSDQAGIVPNSRLMEMGSSCEGRCSKPAHCSWNDA